MTASNREAAGWVLLIVGWPVLVIALAGAVLIFVLHVLVFLAAVAWTVGEWAFHSLRRSATV